MESSIPIKYKLFLKSDEEMTPHNQVSKTRLSLWDAV